MLRWSINLFRIFGIQLAVHGSFLLLLAYAAWKGWQGGGNWTGLMMNLTEVVLFFICVVLHELGHSLTARHYGVQVPRILLMPIGGMAEFDRIPRQPAAELIITINGPLVNFAIALLLWGIVGLPKGMPFDPQIEVSRIGVAHLLLFWNIAMGFFNLLPVFPMDGGRIFRALLTTRLPYLRATFWAARIGQILAIIFVGAAIWFELWMPAVLFSFIFMVGAAEYQNLARQEQRAAYLAEIAKRVTAATKSPDYEPTPPPRLIIHGPN